MIRLQHGLRPDFHMHGAGQAMTNPRRAPRKPGLKAEDIDRFSSPAPGMQQAAVDGVHSIDFPEVKRAVFLLTLKMKGVKTTSFFDSF
jgi:hypothetical protein